MFEKKVSKPTKRAKIQKEVQFTKAALFSSNKIGPEQGMYKNKGKKDRKIFEIPALLSSQRGNSERKITHLGIRGKYFSKKLKLFQISKIFRTKHSTISHKSAANGFDC